MAFCNSISWIEHNIARSKFRLHSSCVTVVCVPKHWYCYGTVMEFTGKSVGAEKLLLFWLMEPQVDKRWSSSCYPEVKRVYSEGWQSVDSSHRRRLLSLSAGVLVSGEFARWFGWLLCIVVWLDRWLDSNFIIWTAPEMSENDTISHAQDRLWLSQLFQRHFRGCGSPVSSVCGLPGLLLLKFWVPAFRYQ
jgi:hypothetical protein